MRYGPRQAVGLIVSLFTRCLPMSDPHSWLFGKISVCLKVVIETLVVTIWLL